MPIGMAVGGTSIVVATPGGTTRYRNAVSRIDGGESSEEESELLVDGESGTFLVGDRAFEAASEGATTQPLIGEGDSVDPEVAEAGVKALLSASGTDPDGIVRYVVRNESDGEALAGVLGALGYEPRELDPGLAVLYDGLDAPATGVGIAVHDDLVAATFAVGGIPVATARIDATSDWYGYGKFRGEATDAKSVAATWLAVQYENLFDDLAQRLGATAPALDESVPVVVGGDAAPAGMDDRLSAALASGLPFAVEAVTVVADPGAALARGALVAAKADDGTPAPVPAFGVDVPRGPGLDDLRRASERLGAGMEAATPTAKAGDRADGVVVHSYVESEALGDRDDVGTTNADLLAALSGVRRDLADLERRSARTARSLTAVVDGLDSIGATGDDPRLAELQRDVEDLQARLSANDSAGADELASMRETVDALVEDVEELEASAVTVDDVDAELSDLETSVDRLSTHLDDVRAAIANLDEDVSLDDLTVSGDLREDLEALESRYSEGVDHLWSEIDDLSAEVTDVAATAKAVPDLESTITSTREQVMDLKRETENLERTVSQTRSDLASLKGSVASESQVEAVEADLASVSSDLAELREGVSNRERVDPETVEQLEKNLTGLRKTLVSTAERLEDLQEETDELDDRIETVYQNSAKSEALASTQSEVSRIRQTAQNAIERSEDVSEEVDRLASSVESQRKSVRTMSTNVDNLAANAVTRSEMDAAIEDLEARLEGIDREEPPDVEPVEEPEVAGVNPLAITIMAVGIVAIGLLGGIFALNQGLVGVAAAFVIFSFLPGLFAWLVS